MNMDFPQDLGKRTFSKSSFKILFVHHPAIGIMNRDFPQDPGKEGPFSKSSLNTQLFFLELSRRTFRKDLEKGGLGEVLSITV